MTAAARDDAVHRRQAQPGPLARRLRREEGIEDAFHRRRVDAVAVIGDGHAHRALLAFADRPGLNDDAPVVVDRVPGVDGQIHEHLLELAAVEANRRHVLAEAADDRDPLFDQAPEHRHHCAHDLVQVEQLQLERLLAAEHEQLSRQGARALRGVHDLLERLVEPTGLAATHLGDRCVAGNHREQIVEVVGNARCEMPDGLEPLRVRKLLPRALVFRHVEREADRARLPVDRAGRPRTRP